MKKDRLTQAKVAKQLIFSSFKKYEPKRALHSKERIIGCIDEKRKEFNL